MNIKDGIQHTVKKDEHAALIVTTPSQSILQQCYTLIDTMQKQGRSQASNVSLMSLQAESKHSFTGDVPVGM
jgi:hypothetical protein